MSSHTPQGRNWFVAIVATLFVIGVGLTLYLNWNTLNPTQPEKSAEDYLRIKSIGLGYLETERAEESILPFTEIAEAYPEESLGLQNLVIARLMYVEQLDKGRDSELWNEQTEQLHQIVQKLVQLQPNKPSSYILQGRALLLSEKNDEGIGSLLKAVELDKTDAATRYEIYEAGRFASKPLSLTASIQLAAAAKLAPNNLFLANQWLKLQATNQDEDIINSLNNAQKSFSILESNVQKRVRISLDKIFVTAIQAVKSNDWNKANQQIQILNNVTRSEEAIQSDRLRLLRNPLEFVVLDFPPPFYQDHNLSSSKAGEAIDVKYTLSGIPQLPVKTAATFIEFLDFDLNGTTDIALLNESDISIYSQSSDKSEWETVFSLPLTKSYQHLIVADLDADVDSTLLNESIETHHSADIDIVLSGKDGVLILENKLTEDSQRVLSPVHLLLEQQGVLTTAVGDLDHDGDLDLIHCTEKGVTVWANHSQLTFVPWSNDAIDLADTLISSQATVVDWDRDNDLDVVLPANNNRSAGYLENLRHGKMRWQTFASDNPNLINATSFELIDADANASWDLLGSTTEGLQLTLTKTPSANKVVFKSTSQITKEPVDKFLLIDFDNDGLDDLFTLHNGSPESFRNLSNGLFKRTDILVTGYDTHSKKLKGITELFTNDIDQDGDLDLVGITKVDNEVFIYTNHGGNKNNWLDITLIAQQIKKSGAEASGRVNQYGIGSLLELKNGAQYQPRIVNSAVTHFGIGQSNQADVLRILWTSGIPQNIIHPKSNQLIAETQTLKGSCPYLYAWDGKQYSFVTDLLWASPIGLQTSKAEIMPDRPWEYLKISGEQLKAREGKYQLQITEELWEAAYFDLVELYAIDHPEDVEIFTNEKVGPPFIAEPKIHTVSEPRVIKSVKDNYGRDFSDLLSKTDNKYARPFKNKLRQGYTETHYLELDFGDLSKAKEVKLYLTGWIYPTDTSINIQLSQNNNLTGPRPPFITAPDASNNWIETVPFMGFPGGKTKTIVVDISEAFASSNYKLRINTSNEIYWDSIFYTVDDSEVEIVQQPLTLLSADLQYRGVSEIVFQDNYAPDLFMYDQVNHSPAWPTMQGNFTKFGDVVELLRKQDAELVVIGTGDEITLTFEEPNKKLPLGWKRDFVLHNVGWDKDADLNTVYGQTVEPLPFIGMSSYPIPPNEIPSSNASYQNYLKTYQTRRQSHPKFNQAIRYYNLSGN